jgi:UDP-glucose 4-epimerase
MGMTKALMEKLVRSDDYPSQCTSVITRYGNVIGSRGSVIPQFIESIKKHRRVTVTNLQMTRFMMSLEESVELVLFALENGQSSDLFVQKSPAATVETIVDALSILLDVSNVEIDTVGIRPGEKFHETLLTAEERSLATEHDRYFQVGKHRNSNLEDKELNTSIFDEYTSANTNILNANELANLLLTIPMVAETLRK